MAFYCSREHKDFVKDVFSTDIDTVAEKQGIEKALVTMLSDDLNQKYVDCARMDPAAFKVKHKNAQYIYLNIGRSGVSFSLRAFIVIIFD